MNIGSANPELSADVLVALLEKFAGDERNEIANILREFHWMLRLSVAERIHLNILHAANDLECVRKLVELAKRDWRDVIVATEYELRNGKLVQTEWSKEMARKREAQYIAGKPSGC
jgi:hypothetical protein